jgi:cytoskeletal protein CcmA (bactofilin family)
LFTFRPASKNGNGHKDGNGNGNGHSNGNGNGHNGGWLGGGHRNGNGHSNGNGNGHSGKIESVLGPGMHIKGDITGTGGVRIEGTFDGAISINGPLVIADGAKVTADVQATAVSVGGSLKGNITARKVDILSTGRIWGDLVTTAFSTEEGAFLRGQVRMEDDVPSVTDGQPTPEIETEAAE